MNGKAYRQLGLALMVFSVVSPSWATIRGKFPQLVHPFRFYMDNERIYITEKASIFIHLRGDFRLLKKIGKPGEGPIEFPTQGGEVLFTVRPDHIIVRCITRLSYFKKNGEFIRETPVPPSAGRYLAPIGEFFVGRKYSMEKKVRFHGIYLYNSSFQKVKEIYRHRHGFQGFNVPFNPIAVDEADFEISADRIFVCDAERTHLRICDGQGNLLAMIVSPGEKIRFTEKDRQELIDGYKYDALWSRMWESRRHLFQFPEYLPPIRWFHIDQEQKKVYVETFWEKNGQRKWLVFDFSGKQLAAIFLPTQGLHGFHDGKHYRLTENEETQQWEMQVSDVIAISIKIP